MGNTESTAAELHDNYLAVLKSVEGRLGQYPSRTLSPRSQSSGVDRSRARVRPEEAYRDPGKRGAGNRPRNLPSKGEKPSRSAHKSGSTSSVDQFNNGPGANRKHGKDSVQRRDDAPPQADQEHSSLQPADGKRRPAAKGETPNVESTATGSDWGDSAVNDFAEEDSCAVESPAHFKLQTKESGVKAPSPRLFPCETLYEVTSQIDLADEKTQVEDGELSSLPSSPTASAEVATDKPGEGRTATREDTRTGRSAEGDRGPCHTENQVDGADAKENESDNSHGESDQDLRRRSDGRGASSQRSRDEASNSGEPPSQSKPSQLSKQIRKKELAPEPLRAADIDLSSDVRVGASLKGGKGGKGDAEGDNVADLTAGFEGFSPYSPSYSLGFSQPSSKKAAKTTAENSKAHLPGGTRGSGNNTAVDRDACIYGNKKNHFPFLDEPALSLLVPFLFGRSLATCMTVCPHWFMKINRAMERMCGPATKGFQQMYSKYLEVWGSAVKLQPLQTVGDGGVRVDWVIFAKVLPECEGHILDISYTYSYISESSSSTARPVDEADKPAAGGKRDRGRQGEKRRSLSANFDEGVILSPCGQPCPTNMPSRVFTVSYSLAAGAAKSSRTLWMHRDLCRFHGDETGVAAMGSVSSVCVGDFVEVAVTVYNGGGRVALDKVKWLPARVEWRREAVSTRGVFNREICPLERCSPDWLPADQFRIMTTERLKAPEDFSPCLKHVKTEFSGMDVAVRKSTYRAVRQGSLGSAACRSWGFPCEILPQGVPVVCSLTRWGLQHDRFLSVQLREGDIIDYYMSQGGANA
ncbi:hypothetical protein TGME49_310930 [Toxoplasma gondii ME49]|uniref:Uncharacterized protein n=2 Tax=Toxoplasma gondii TaxID=5811 RepID=B6KAF9_TOXGV|nr:hypothetical protein TGME49_310930 [Toxoplasma gondii ME49]EPT26137.1 hypothetical protein TGME49_310930 [Toxoplasma gondii ME49]ESS34933.1 hypothetical protein TGVEG_310930 [Toxoplasma gondii VEG]CEL77387.1 TPA: hypothetical protein BN1205_095020 [Toxoplasma gondii VEG]|eukprot:XP_002364337.1 hypothetical protein TGME49_310930 [Toxoplasma gondii ME49]